jgi:hypothetical protein
MKKFTLFLLSGLFAFAAFAAAPQPQVTLRIYKNYEVTIDGQRYTGNSTASYLSQGYHQVQVFSTKGFLIKKRTLVSSSSFNMRNSDVLIDVDQNGQLHIYQNNSYGSNGGYDNRNGNYDSRNGNRGNGNGYGPYNNPGRGHKYGLYKNKNKNHDRDENDNRYERDDD